LRSLLWESQPEIDQASLEKQLAELEVRPWQIALLSQVIQQAW
jgi:hypothetical protein